MAAPFIAACVQINAARDIEENILTLERLIDEAHAKGAQFITTPECSGAMEPDSERMMRNTPAETDHPTLAAMIAKAVETRAWLLIGSLAVKRDDGKIANRSYLISPTGEIAATYDKIHMFDVELGDGQYYRESESYEPGTLGVTAELPWGRVGLSICYDVRFAYLYRALAQNGAEFLTVPAAFTKVSGEAHWHVLQRARAIETGSYVIAAAQCGTHAEDRQTFGHSLIIDPWGQILADAGEYVGVITAEIDPAKVIEARSKIPALTHDRPFALADQTIEESDKVAVLRP